MEVAGHGGTSDHAAHATRLATDMLTLSYTNTCFTIVANLALTQLCQSYTGGSYMAVAGHDGASDHAARAMRLAADMLTHVSSSTFCGERLQLVIGVHCGPAQCGVVGTEAPRFALFGDAAATAMALQVGCIWGHAVVLSAAASWAACITV